MCNQVKSGTKHGRSNQSYQKETVALIQKNDFQITYGRV